MRSILNVDLRSFDANGGSLMEVEFSGSNANFSDLINSAVVKPLNAKAGSAVFKLGGIQGNVINLDYRSEMNSEELADKFSAAPPASLINAPAARISQLVQSETTKRKVEAFRAEGETPGRQELLKNVADF